MNKKLIIPIAIGCGILLLVLCTVISIFLIPKVIKNMKKTQKEEIKENSTEVESRVTIGQSELYFSDFFTEESSNKYVAHVVLTPFLSVNYNKTITDFEIININVSGITKGEVAVIKPQHISSSTTSYNYILGPIEDEVKTKDIVDAGNKIKYTVVNTVKYNDEMLVTGGGMPQFKIVIKNIGYYNPNDHIFDSGSNLKYAGVTANDLNLTVSFDLKITFDDGNIYYKHFSTNIDGNKALSQSFYTEKFKY